MVNIQDIEKEIMELQETIENALKKLQKPRGSLAKFSKMADLEDGRPNKFFLKLL
jgi:hypothetical protein